MMRLPQKKIEPGKWLANLSRKSDQLQLAERQSKIASIPRQQYNSNIKKCSDEWDGCDLTTDYKGSMLFSFI